MAETLSFRGELKGHSGWVTSIATHENSDLLLSSSRDKTIIIWEVTGDGEEYGYARKALRGHSHFVEEVIISSDGLFALSASWDGTLRLWDLRTGETTQRFLGHTKDVMSVAFSKGNRQIVSGSRDKTVKLWNTIGECKYTIENGHTDWVSCVRFSPSEETPLIISCGWDKLVKVWNMNNLMKLYDLVGHTGFVSSVTVSPDGSLCASGGKDAIVMLWDLNEGKRLYTLEAGSCINALEFSPSRYWLVAATEKCIKVWDLESKVVVKELVPEWAPRSKKALTPFCTSLAWSADGQILYSGYTDNVIRVWNVTLAQTYAPQQ